MQEQQKGYNYCVQLKNTNKNIFIDMCKHQIYDTIYNIKIHLINLIFNYKKIQPSYNTSDLSDSDYIQAISMCNSVIGILPNVK